ncbi:gamma-glutamylcyclotransferase [Pseudoalteromonas sp. MMG013]|uniref:gamma-glutamylcyclotransferase family protein n=1 Tax=Pseudoalteromonas sp. MMG013 TaxID=2822687 RepID=UPI001B367FBE|nr:gamma-glutamylcyclotransferase family protein [Pseudoalteromonas sp. MMG013]MBQ4861187.1 gamma-glutamylcyclotransferase [Pseudoalteromonas sp. MMG013]
MEIATYYNFAFGSNMSSKRLLARLPQAKKVGVAQLYGFELNFSMLSTDGSAKCNIHRTHSEHNVVFGVLYALNAQEQLLLDNIEGTRYDRTEILVELISGEKVSAYCYIANTFIADQLPFDWYVQHVYAGALEHGFPISYLECIQQQRTVVDVQKCRSENELSIYKNKEVKNNETF